MRILTISNCFLAESLGSGYVIVNFCRHLRQRGHDVDLYGPETFEPLPFLKGRARSYRLALGMLFFARRQMRRKRYDIIEFYGGESWLATWWLDRIPRRRFLIASHSNGLETHYIPRLASSMKSGTVSGARRKWYQLDQTALFERSFTHADGIVSVSREDVPFALQHHYQDADHVVAIDNSLPEAFLNLQVNFERPPIIGFCGSWMEQKGMTAIRGALNLVLRDHREWRLHLVGVGKEFDKTTQFDADVCAQIEVTAFVEDKEELRAIYQQMAISLMPSLTESFGLVAAEAMACGCALIASHTGFAAALEHGQEAWILEQPTAAELAAAISHLIENPALREQIARNGYQRVQRLRWELATQQLEEVYTRWLKTKREALANP